MIIEKRCSGSGAKTAAIVVAATLLIVCARQALGLTQDAGSFPEGYDAVTAAPGSHKVIFENGLVRVLEVTMPPPGKTEPMHHHHWPGFFLDWDTGGKSPHIRYHQPGNLVREVPTCAAALTGFLESPKPGGTIPRMFWDLPICAAALKVRKALADGDAI